LEEDVRAATATAADPSKEDDTEGTVSSSVVPTAKPKDLIGMDSRVSGSEEMMYLIRWNGHKSTPWAGMSYLLKTDKLLDITLATSDGQILKSNRMVLTLSSGYFRKVFDQLEKLSPELIIFLKDIKSTSLKAILDFIYFGEVQLCSTQISDFLGTATALWIKGIAQDPTTTAEEEDESRRLSTENEASTSSSGGSKATEPSSRDFVVVKNAEGVRLPRQARKRKNVIVELKLQFLTVAYFGILSSLM
jgi:uncharacterized membrane protein